MSIARYTQRSGLSPAFSNRLGTLFPELRPMHQGWMPAVNVEERDAEIVLTAELPGMSEDHVELELENNILTIRGDKQEEREEGEAGGRYHLSERTYGSFQRSFTVPRTVNPENIDAHFEDGVLTIHLPKAPEAKSRRITIGKKA